MGFFDLFRKFSGILFKESAGERSIRGKNSGWLRKHLKPGKSHGFITALFNYRDPLVRALVHEIKYRNNQELRNAVGILLCEEIGKMCIGGGLAVSDNIVTRVPPHRLHRRERGFDHTALILNSLPASIKMYAERQPDVIQKIRETPAQTSLKGSARRKNLLDAFRLSRRGEIDGKTIFVIDDVVTTGSTLGEIHKTLLEAGARRVLACVIASQSMD